MMLAGPAFAVAPDGGVVTPPTVQPDEAKALSRAFAAIAKAVRPSVVRIDVEETRNGARRAQPQGELPEFFDRFFGEPDSREAPMRGTGSGVVFDTAGHIVTNRHVVANADKMTVTLVDGRELTAKVVGKDSRTDVAVLKLDQPPKDLVAAREAGADVGRSRAQLSADRREDQPGQLGWTAGGSQRRGDRHQHVDQRGPWRES